MFKKRREKWKEKRTIVKMKNFPLVVAQKKSNEILKAMLH